MSNEKKKAPKDDSPEIYGYAFGSVHSSDEFGGRVKHGAGGVFPTTEKQLERLQKLNAARPATEEEIADYKEAQDEKEEPVLRSVNDPLANDLVQNDGRPVGNYHKYKHETGEHVGQESDDLGLGDEDPEPPVVKYELDENGEPVLDSDGNPIPVKPIADKTVVPAKIDKAGKAK